MWEVQQKLSPELSAYLDIDSKNIKNKSELWDYLRTPQTPDKAGLANNRPAMVDIYISNVLQNSFPAQFESSVRRDNHAKLLRKAVEWEFDRSRQEYNEDTVQRVADDLYGKYTTVDTGSAAKLTMPNSVLAPYRITKSVMRDAKPFFLRKQQKLGKKIGIQGLNEQQGKSLLKIAENVLSGNGGSLDWGVVNGNDGGTRVVLMHYPDGSDRRLGRIVADLTADGEPIRYNEDQTVQNFISGPVAEWADASNDTFDKINIPFVWNADFSRERIMGFVNNSEKYRKEAHYTGANFLDGSITREFATDPGRREMDAFIIPLGEKIKAFEIENKREININELEIMYDEQLNTMYTVGDRYTNSIGTWLKEFIANQQPQRPLN